MQPFQNAWISGKEKSLFVPFRRRKFFRLTCSQRPAHPRPSKKSLWSGGSLRFLHRTDITSCELVSSKRLASQRTLRTYFYHVLAVRLLWLPAPREIEHVTISFTLLKALRSRPELTLNKGIQSDWRGMSHPASSHENEYLWFFFFFSSPFPQSSLTDFFSSLYLA